jgi:hypothetical protein
MEYIFNSYFWQGLALYLLGLPVLVLIAGASLKYHIEKYDVSAHLLQKTRLSAFQPLNLFVSRKTISRYFAYYEMNIDAARNGRISLIVLAVLVEYLIVAKLFTLQNVEFAFLPTAFWGALYMVSFLRCWHFGDRLKNAARQVQ